MGEQPRGFWIAAREEPDRIALIDAEERAWTAGELLTGADRMVHALRARGVECFDPVATLTRNSAELFQTLLAVFQGGWQYVGLNTHLTADEVGYILADSGAKALVADAAFGDVARQAAETAGIPEPGRIAVGGDIPGFTSLDDLLSGQPATAPEDRVAGQFMQYTSGTTGRPKAVQRDLPQFDPETWVAAYSANLTRYDIEVGGDAVHLVTSPMYHLSPLSFGYFSLHLEHTVVLMEKWDAERALQLIDRYHVTDVAMVPTQLHRLMALPEDVRAKYDVSSLRQVIHAAAPCPVDLKLRLFEWLGPVIYEFYGASEGGGTLAKPHDWLAHPGTVGTPWPGADIKILDDDGNELPAGTVGTVYLKLMGEFAYKGDPDKTAANRRGDFFTVGDMGELDDEGFLYLRDRKIDMVVSGGVNIYPAEVEAALLSHPKVGDAAVFGIPDDDWGEAVQAVVEPASGIEPSPELASELLAHCEGRLARYKLPRRVDFVETMPRDPNGKLYKRTLRDPYWVGRERAI
ncbi:MAG: long-chain acyl-CoA synthetase [Actinomycetota bacterium]|nr:long-chain acyl-CoA synthetase [Actinomycetota bacterium]